MQEAAAPGGMLSDFPPGWAGRAGCQGYFVLSCFTIQAEGERERKPCEFSARLVVKGTGVGII